MEWDEMSEVGKDYGLALQYYGTADLCIKMHSCCLTTRE